MTDEANFQKMLQALERELRDLKTSHAVGGGMLMFSASILPESTNPLIIQYAAGSQPILTQVFTDAEAVLGPVDENSNTQKVFFSSQAIVKVAIASTRQIVSITQ